MIAQPALTTGPKPHAQQQQQQAQPQNAGGFQSLLTTDSSLMDLAQNTGATVSTKAAKVQQAANANKPKSDDATSYVAAATQPIQPPPAQPAAPSAAAQASTQPSPTPPILPSDGKALDASAVPNNAVLPATAPADTAATTDQNSNGNSTAFGADALNARIVSGAPIYASQPNTSMATVPPHLLDAANAHPLPGQPVGKPGDDTNGKASSDATATLPSSTANAATTPVTPSLPNRAASAAADNANNNNGDNSATPPSSGDNSATATNNDPSTPNASLLAQPNQPQTAPVPVDATVHTAAPYVPVGEQVALNLKQAIAADNNEIRIQLKPASLGTIDVKLNVGQDGRVNAVISADRSDTLNMLKQDAGTLQQALRDAGLNADSSSLSFNLSGDAQSFAQNWSQGSSSGNGSGGNAYTGTTSDALAGMDAIAPTQRLHAGALDIEV